MAKNKVIVVQNINITVSEENFDDYICITDIAKAKVGESSEAGLHTFVLSVSEWIEKTEAIGLFVKRGKFGGTYAHKDIAFEFASAISPIFKLYLIKEFQRLKEAENDAEKIEWDVKRFLSKNNYLIQTDAVKNYLIPTGNYKENREWLAYAEEADILNVALFGFTVKAWRDKNPELAKKEQCKRFCFNK